MNDTNEEMTQKLKASICDYYMGHIKQKLSFLIAGGKENEISNQIMEFLDAQIDTNNSVITKDDIIRILTSSIVEDYSDSFSSELEKNRISYCFPNVATVNIDCGQAAYITIQVQTPLDGIYETSYYLYMSPEYYKNNIETVELDIKRLEKAFSNKDLRSFEEKYNSDLSQKQYELESARVYESASRQIELKKQKFNSVSQKLINDYGRKYEEIISKDNISSDEKAELTNKLLFDTKSFDEKNRLAISRLNKEYEQLLENFQGKIESFNTIYSQMQNLHLFDKNRYFEDMKMSVNPELKDLYKKRYLLNSYRKSHGEPIYNGKQSSVSNIFSNIFKGFKSDKLPVLPGPKFERDIPTR